MELAELGGLVVVLLALLAVDVRFFAPGREATFRESVAWSLGWLALGLAVTVVVYALNGGEDAVNYATVYLIERSLSLDNLFVFILLFAYFGVPHEQRARLLFWGIIAALILRGLAILGGTTLIAQFHAVLYLLGVALLVLAWRIYRGVGDDVDPDRNIVVRGVRRVVPVSDGFRGGHWFVREDGRRHVTPAFLCLAAIGTADIAFAVDSIPAAFAITTDPLIIWAGNVFALLGLRALFVLVEGLIKRFRFLDETIAVVLAVVALKILIEPLVKIGPLASLGLVAVVFGVGIGASLYADRRDPEGAAERRAEVADDGPDVPDDVRPNVADGAAASPPPPAQS
jgi:tellurite resistance protein TerC